MEIHSWEWSVWSILSPSVIFHPRPAPDPEPQRGLAPGHRKASFSGVQLLNGGAWIPKVSDSTMEKAGQGWTGLYGRERGALQSMTS